MQARLKLACPICDNPQRSSLLRPHLINISVVCLFLIPQAWLVIAEVDLLAPFRGDGNIEEMNKGT